VKLMESMVAWDPRTDRIRVGPWPDKRGWSDDYLYTTGACELRRHDMSDVKQQQMMFIDFHTIVVRDKVPVDVAHFEFRKIDEYRQLISRNIPGAEGPSDIGQMIAYYEQKEP